MAENHLPLRKVRLRARRRRKSFACAIGRRCGCRRFGCSSGSFDRLGFCRRSGRCRNRRLFPDGSTCPLPLQLERFTDLFGFFAHPLSQFFGLFERFARILEPGLGQSRQFTRRLGLFFGLCCPSGQSRGAFLRLAPRCVGGVAFHSFTSDSP